MEFVFSKPFRRAFARLSPRRRGETQKAVGQYRIDRTQPKLADHALKGHMTGLRAFSAAWDLRVIYREEDGFITIILLDAGTHSQVY